MGSNRNADRSKHSRVKDMPVTKKCNNKFVVRYCMSAFELANLTSAFPELNILAKGDVNHPHGLAAAVRDATEELILLKIGYRKTMQSLDGKDVWIIDVGSNFVRHVKSGRLNIHCCVPIMDIRDSARDTCQRMSMQKMIHDGGITKETYDWYMKEPGSNVRCFKRAEECKKTANYGILIRSEYDITEEQLLQIFDSHELDVAYLAINFVPQVFYRMSGTLPNQNGVYSVENGRITFGFALDTSLNYSHGYSDYIRLIKSQAYVTPRGRLYTAERVDYRMDVLYVRYTHSARRPKINELNVNTAVWFKDEAKVVISTWEFDDLYICAAKDYTARTRVSFRRKFIEISRLLYDLIYSYSIRSGDKSFNLNEILSVAISFDSRFTINGVDIEILRRIPTEDLLWVVVAVHCIAYRKRFAAGMVMQNMSNTEKIKCQNTHFSFAGLCSALWRRFSSASLLDPVKFQWNELITTLGEWRSLGDLDVKLLESVRVIEMDEFLKITAARSDENIDDFILRDLSTNAFDVVLDKKEFKHKIGKILCDTLYPTESEVLPACTDDGDEGSAVPDIKSTLSKRKARSILQSFHRCVDKVDHKAEDSVERVRRAKGELKQQVECGSNKVLRIKGDGHCMYRALGMFIGIADPLVMRDFVWSWCTEEEKLAHADIMIKDGSPSGWGNTFLLTIFSRATGFRVCTHVTVDSSPTVTTCGYSDPNASGPVIHLSWTVAASSGHVDVILDQVRGLEDIHDECLEFQDFLDKYQFPHVPYTSGNWKSMYDYVYKHNLRNKSKTAHLHSLGILINRSAYKLSEIMERYCLDLAADIPILDLCGAPGGFLQVLTELAFTNVTSVSVTDHYNRAVFDPSYKIIIADINNFIPDRKYALILADGAAEQSHLNEDIFSAEVRIALAALEDNGMLIIKHSNYFLQLSDQLTPHFSKIEKMKPFTSRETNTEFYIIATGFKNGPAKVILDEVKEVCVAGIRTMLDRKPWSKVSLAENLPLHSLHKSIAVAKVYNTMK